jgi:hypothetical protein
MKRKILIFVLGMFSVSACGPAILPTSALSVPVSPSPLPPTFLSPAMISTATSITSLVDCTQNPPIQPKGSLVNVEFENQSGAVILSFGMNEPNDKNECVIYSYTIPEAGVNSTQVLAGCYWGYGWVDGGENAKTDSLLCLTDPNAVYHVLIMKETIVFQ